MGKADINHAERKHALLSASGSSRWLNCTPSARLEDTVKSDNGSVFAAEGTLAHEFCDIGLRLASGLLTKEEYQKEYSRFSADPLYNPEMDEFVQQYIDYVLEQLEVAKKITEGPVLLIEEKVDFSEYVEDGFGMCDANIIADEILEIIDFKYGKGLKVDALNNSQLKLYALGALRKYDLSYDIKTLRLTIVQPRLDHIDSWEISVDDLMEWAEGELKTKARLAYEGKGELCSGSWCKWCKVKGRCRKLAEENLALAKYEFKDPDLLSDEELLEVFHKAGELKDWAEAVADTVFKDALGGKQWKGLKVVEGRSLRKYTDPKKVLEVLMEAGHRKDKVSETKVLALGKLEKYLGKDTFNVLLGEYIIKPPGKPTLVPESDKRIPMELGAEADFKD